MIISSHGLMGTGRITRIVLGGIKATGVHPHLVVVREPNPDTAPRPFRQDQTLSR